MKGLTVTEVVSVASIESLREIAFAVAALLVVCVIAVEITLFRQRHRGSGGKADEP